jgi:hypothetical protein
MDRDEQQILSTLWSQARARLRREHWLKYLGLGIWGAVAAELLLALIHLYLAPVSPEFIFWAGIAPLAAAGAYAYFSDAVSLETGARALDRWFVGRSLMTTAYEVVSTQRIGSAERHILQQAMAVAPEWQIQLRQRPFNLHRARPAGAVVAGLLALFLLLLPPTQYRQASRPDAMSGSPAKLRNTEERPYSMPFEPGIVEPSLEYIDAAVFDADNAIVPRGNDSNSPSSDDANGTGKSGTEKAGQETASKSQSLSTATDTLWKTISRTATANRNGTGGGEFSKDPELVQSAATHAVPPGPTSPMYQQRFNPTQTALINAYFDQTRSHP